jgi:hypothetical protein
VQGLLADVQKKLLLTVGSHRANRPLSPVEVAEAVQASLDAGSSLHDIAGELYLEGTTVLSDFLRLLRLTPEVRHVVGWGRPNATIGFKAAAEVAGLEDPTDQVKLCRACLEHKLGKAEVRQAVQLRKRSKKSIEECVNEVLQMRPRVQLLHVLMGAVTSAKVRARLSSLTQAERDELLQKLIRRRFPEIGQFNCRLGTQGFTITGSEGVAAMLARGGTDFETAINSDFAETASP